METIEIGGVNADEGLEKEASGNVPNKDPQTGGNPFVDESKSNRTNDKEKRYINTTKRIFCMQL